MKRVILITTGIALVFCLFLVSFSSSYTTDGGLEIGDSARFSFSLKFANGTFIQGSSGFDTQVNYGQLIVGFVDGVEGMKIDEIRNFEVPPEKGYSGNHELAGVVLVYEVKLLAVSNPPPNIPTEDGNNIITTVLWVGLWIFLALVGIAVVITIFKLTRTKTGAKCIVCGDVYNGTCSKCNKPYCKSDFGMKCQSCGNKVFTHK